MKKEFPYKLKAVIFYKTELENFGEYADGAEEFFENLRKHGVEIWDIREELIKQGMQKRIAREKCRAEEVLVIAATDAVISEAKLEGIAVFAFQNQDYPEQSLMGARVLVESLEGLDFEFAERIWRRYHGLPWDILKTGRCYVRELTLEDLEDLFEMYQQEGMTDYMEPLYDRQEEAVYQQAYIDNMYGFYGYGMWLVFDRKTQKLIGRAGLENRERNGVFGMELGYAIAVPYQRKGYATEVCRAILQYAKNELDVTKVDCLIQQANTASLALAVKLGFRYEETIMEDGKVYERYNCVLKENTDAKEKNSNLEW